MRVRLQSVLFGVLGVGVLVAIWDLYKALGPDAGVRLGERVLVLPRASDLAMPHSWDMVQRLFEPVVGAAGDNLVFAVAEASWFTLKLSAIGWLMGLIVGLALALLMARFRVAEAGVLPWVILSQTVPLIAIAPLVRRWGAQIEIGSFQWQNEHSVSLIAAYLAFFPIAVGALRGLKSPQRTHLELMRAYGIGWWRTFITLRIPASVPFLLPALRLGAASAVIGAVVAEVSIGLRGGVGRMVVEYAQSASGDPAKAWAPIFGAVAVGLVAAGAVGLVGLALRPFRLTGASS